MTPPAPEGVRGPGLLPEGTHLRAWARGLTKVYGSGRWAVRALDGVDVDFEEARFTAIMGPSGSGKSTLMHCMAGLDTITSGQVVVGDHDLSHMGQRALTRLRREEVGFIFQSFNLIPTLTARENILLPLDIAHRRVDRDWFEEVVATVGLGDRLTHRPDELSGGQQQRVACARALVSKPAVVFADEPTGNLDSRAATDMLSLLRRSVDELGQTVVMVTHDARAASFAHRVLFLADGRIVEDLHDPTLESILGQLAELTPAGEEGPGGERGEQALGAGGPGEARAATPSGTDRGTTEAPEPTPATPPSGGAGPAPVTPPSDEGGAALVSRTRRRGHPAHALTPEPEDEPQPTEAAGPADGQQPAGEAGPTSSPDRTGDSDGEQR